MDAAHIQQQSTKMVYFKQTAYPHGVEDSTGPGLKVLTALSMLCVETVIGIISVAGGNAAYSTSECASNVFIAQCNSILICSDI